MSRKKRVLVACESSGTVRDAFSRLGFDSWSCDLLQTDSPGNHIQGDAIEASQQDWDLMIAHPPCTYLTVTGNKWFKPEFRDRFPDREKKREDALNFFIDLFERKTSHIGRVCCENPVGYVSSAYMKPTQYVHPYHFGDPHSKKTGLWLRNLPCLVHTKIVEPVFYVYKDGRKDPLWHVETMKLPPLERMKARSKTFKGIAEAMASQWGKLL